MGSALCHRRDLDTKQSRLTLGELEALAGLGLTGFLTLDRAGVASHEAFGAESGFVFGVNLNQSAGDSETQSFGLTFVAAAVEVYVDVVLFSAVKCKQRLLYDVLKNFRREVCFEGAMIDSDSAVTFFEDYAGNGGLAATNGVYIFHIDAAGLIIS